ncbi:LSU ribosomal protein L21p [Lachnospiraceae bacterium TWA4]|nr:LSU ribosomal protein L21p [Lachnospiraceae bacterium TWA4]
MYAIIATGGKQYKVSEGDVIRVEKLGVEAGSTYDFDQVLAVSDDTLTVGSPVVEGAKVTATVVGDVKGKKLLFTSTREKLDIIKRMVTDRTLLKLKSKKSQNN